MKIRNLILIIGTAAFLCLLSLGTLICPDRAFSENENRYLQSAPRLTFDKVLSGDFAEDAEGYLTDQIVFREAWVTGKNLMERAMGIHDMNGVYLCEDGRLVERITDADFNWRQYKRNLQQISLLTEELKKENIPVDVMMVPTAAYVCGDVLPDHAVRFDEDKAFTQAEVLLGDSLIDLRPQMTREDTFDMFFRTDHHWTGFGTFTGYNAYRERLGEEVLTWEDCKPETLTEEFYGTLYSKVLLPSLTPDMIQIPADALDAEYTVMMDGEMHGSLFFRDYLDKKDKYAVYFGGNYAKVDISMENSRGSEDLLIIKDSFANSFVPYLLDDFGYITMVDTRFYREDISQLAKSYDRVLVLYGMANMGQQRMVLLSGLNGGE